MKSNHLGQLFLIIIAGLLLVPISNTKAADSFDLGNQAYMHKDYTAALNDYRQTAAELGYSASLLYNMGNSYTRLGKTGPAILAYEQARLLEPSNPDIQANLTAVRKANGIYRQDQPWWQRAITILNADQWLLISGISFALFSACFLLPVLLKDTSWYTRTLKAATAVTLLCALLALVPAIYGYYHRQDGVVLDQTRLRISPFAEADSAGTIKAGRIVHPLKSYKNYILIRDANNRKGWLAADELGWLSRLGKTEEKP